MDRAELKNALLEHMYERVRRGRMNKEATISTLKKALPVKDDMSNNYVEVLIDSLMDRGLVRDFGGSGRYCITEEGIALIESGNRFSDEPSKIVDSWEKPDGKITLTIRAVEGIQFHLGQCLQLLSFAELTQEEKSQAAGLIKICQQILELPTPKLGLLRRILGWLKEIKELLPLIEAVLKLTGKA